MYIYGLVQDCSNASAWALELLQSCTKPSIYDIDISEDILVHLIFPYESLEYDLTDETNQNWQYNEINYHDWLSFYHATFYYTY